MQGKLTLTETARRLGVSRMTVGRLIREGALPVTANPLDKRQKLVPESAIRQLEGVRVARPYPVTVGMISDEHFLSEEAEYYMLAHRIEK
jgi:excisionase family DNA binding protein